MSWPKTQQRDHWLRWSGCELNPHHTIRVVVKTTSLSSPPHSWFKLLETWIASWKITCKMKKVMEDCKSWRLNLKLLPPHFHEKACVDVASAATGIEPDLICSCLTGYRCQWRKSMREQIKSCNFELHRWRILHSLLLRMVASAPGVGFGGGALFRTKIRWKPKKKKGLRLKISEFLVQMRMGTKQSEKRKVFTTNR